jgi:hypothetical protein
MLVSEAKAIGNILSREVFNKKDLVILNIGSSTKYFRESSQPWVEKYIFRPLHFLSCQVVNVDIKLDEGVDFVADITKELDLNKLKAFNSDIIMASNLLEHVEDLRSTCANITHLLGPETLLILTGPVKFPFHPDPIDNGWRPDELEIRESFPTCVITDFRLVSHRNLQFATMDGIFFVNALKYIFRLIKAFLAFDHLTELTEQFFSPVSAFVVTIRKCC